MRERKYSFDGTRVHLIGTRGLWPELEARVSQSGRHRYEQVAIEDAARGLVQTRVDKSEATSSERLISSSIFPATSTLSMARNCCTCG